MTNTNEQVESLVKRWVRDEVRALNAYHVPAAKDFIKLDAMENPYQWPAELRQQWLELLAGVEINRYPDASGQDVENALRACFNIDEAYELMLGNGSDELIQIIAMALAQPGRTLMAPEPSFVMYRMIAGFVGMDYLGVPLTTDFQLDLDAFLMAIDAQQPALIFLAQPNNPTGTLYPESAVRSILERAPGLVVVDEAYMAFTDSDAMPLLAEYSNLVVMRTLSKVGLAGLRLGFMVGAPAWISEFNKLRLPYNINVLTQASVVFALKQFAVLAEQTARIRHDREQLFTQLIALPLQKVWPSEANFILVRTAAGQAQAVFTAMKEQGVLIKCLHGAHPLLVDCLRLTVGTPKENQAMLGALEQSLAQIASCSNY